MADFGVDILESMDNLFEKIIRKQNAMQIIIFLLNMNF
jgi:hypothetical protein